MLEISFGARLSARWERIVSSTTTFWLSNELFVKRIAGSISYLHRGPSNGGLVSSRGSTDFAQLPADYWAGTPTSFTNSESPVLLNEYGSLSRRIGLPCA